ncbi:MAG TPA: D-glycero-beta-D-manno-heptose 1-phosphate adenylyltransferase [bacterium]|nr:D-glycero-beta-D-manno-heptose 1-phosphate adenylyltransferase [bacterium]HPJ71623.1 D-glycero-beta-D-manno-heptose 1-phosphate adenylyltransferase [bacterium]HPQ66207.1 D-glycero-beta-D-manno-heptose 1-phosphate adenylyltransferase [bacterium]
MSVPDPRILGPGELRKLAEEVQARGGKVVFTNGCFDLLHVGHIRYLRAAAAWGDMLIIGLNSDESVRRLKGAMRPLVPEMERAEILAALEMVDYVCIFPEDTPRELIVALHPDVLVKGGDYVRSQLAGADEVESWGGRVVLAEEVEGKSTRCLLAEIKRRQAVDGR